MQREAARQRESGPEDERQGGGPFSRGGSPATLSAAYVELQELNGELRRLHAGHGADADDLDDRPPPMFAHGEPPPPQEAVLILRRAIDQFNEANPLGDAPGDAAVAPVVAPPVAALPVAVEAAPVVIAMHEEHQLGQAAPAEAQQSFVLQQLVALFLGLLSGGLGGATIGALVGFGISLADGLRPGGSFDTSTISDLAMVAALAGALVMAFVALARHQLFPRRNH